VPPATTLWWVFLGGCVGTGLRAGLGVLLAEPTVGSWVTTLGVNVLGALLLGVLMARLRHREDTPSWLPSLVGVGMLGSFTTYSALAVEANRLGHEAHVIFVVAYPLGSLLLGLVAVATGLRLGGRRPTSSGELA
jgi:fluoride exporter